MMILIKCLTYIFPVLLLTKYYKIRVFPQMGKSFYRAANCVLMSDFVVKFLGALMCQSKIIDFDSYDLMIAYFPAFECLLIFLSYKIVRPKFNQRKIEKKQFSFSQTWRQILFVLLLLLDPLVTLETDVLSLGCVGIVYFYSSQLISDLPDYAAYYTYTLVIYLVVLTGMVLWLLKLRKKENSYQRGVTLSEVTSTKSPIVFLRSFELNRSTVSTYTMDEHLCKGFSTRQQPVISLADPDIAFSSGTIKIQADDMTWKEAIVNLFKSCRAVIMFEGKSDGLNWEIENIRQYIPYDRFFVATPPEDYRIVAWAIADGNGGGYWNTASKFRVKLAQKTDKKGIAHAFSFIWKKFHDKMQINGISIPANEPGSGCLISFDANWNTKEIYTGLNGGDFFNKIIEITKETINEFDYSVLQRSIKDYVIDGEITTETQMKFKHLTNIIVFSQLLLIPLMFFITVLFTNLD